jgi:hypothetical protein
MNSSLFQVISALDALTGALFLLTALGVVATRAKSSPLCSSSLCSLCCWRYRQVS